MANLAEQDWDPSHTLKNFEPIHWQCEITYLKNYLEQVLNNAEPRLEQISQALQAVHNPREIEVVVARFSTLCAMHAVMGMYQKLMPKMREIVDRLEALDEQVSSASQLTPPME